MAARRSGLGTCAMGIGAGERVAYELLAPTHDCAARAAGAAGSGHIARLPIEVDRRPVAASELLALALRFGLSSYDAAYLEVALRRQVPLATQDAALGAAAAACGVGIVVEWISRT